MSVISRVGKFALALKVAFLAVEAGNIFPGNHVNVKNPVAQARDLTADIRGSRAGLTREKEPEARRLMHELVTRPGPYRERFDARLELLKTLGKAVHDRELNQRQEQIGDQEQF